MITASKLRTIGAYPDGLPKYPAKGESRITLDDLERFGAGMICLAGGAMSPLSRSLIRGDDPGQLADRLASIFGPRNLFIDLQRHLDAGEERLNRKLAAFAESAGIPLTVTNDVCHSGTDRRMMDVLTCIRLKTPLEQAGRRLGINGARSLKHPA